MHLLRCASARVSLGIQYVYGLEGKYRLVEEEEEAPMFPLSRVDDAVSCHSHTCLCRHQCVTVLGGGEYSIIIIIIITPLAQSLTTPLVNRSSNISDIRVTSPSS